MMNSKWKIARNNIRRGWTRIFADKTKMLFLFWLAPKKQKAFRNLCWSTKLKPKGKAGKAGKPIFKLTLQGKVMKGCFVLTIHRQKKTTSCFYPRSSASNIVSSYLRFASFYNETIYNLHFALYYTYRHFL